MTASQDMREPSTTDKLLLFAGTIISFGGVGWLLYSRHKPAGIVEAIGEFCALLSVLGLFIFCIAFLVAGLARKGKWSPQKSQCLAAIPFIPLIAIFAFMPSMRAAVPLLFSSGIGAGILCRKFAYADSQAEEAYRAEQELHILSK
jgi:hypothetical protein